MGAIVFDVTHWRGSVHYANANRNYFVNALTANIKAYLQRPCQCCFCHHLLVAYVSLSCVFLKKLNILPCLSQQDKLYSSIWTRQIENLTFSSGKTIFW